MDQKSFVPHTQEETEAFFLCLCKALPLSEDDSRRQAHLLNHPESTGKGVHGYVLPRCTENAWIYEREAVWQKRHLERERAYFRENGIQREVVHTPPDQVPEILFFFAQKAGQITALNGGEDIGNFLTVFYGVSEEAGRKAPYLYENACLALKAIKSEKELLKRFQMYLEKSAQKKPPTA